MGGLVGLLTCSFAVSDTEHTAKSLRGTETHPRGARGQRQVEWGERYERNSNPDREEGKAWPYGKINCKGKLTEEPKAFLVIQLMTPQKTQIWTPESALTHTFVTVLAGLG